MRVKLYCDYVKGEKLIGRYGEPIGPSADVTVDELKGLVKMGSAIEIETTPDTQ